MTEHGPSLHQSFWRPHFTLVLLLVVVTYIVTMLSDNRGWGAFAVILLQGVTLIIALIAAHLSRVWIVAGVVTASISVLLTLASFLLPLTIDARGLQGVVNAALFYLTPVAILRAIGRIRGVTTDIIMGAIAVYLLIGMAFSYAYAADERFSGRPFFAEITDATTSDFLFFSFVTLTTVGYGNLVPQGDWGRTLATIEALFGQIYLVIIVARLVSLWKTPGEGGARI